MNSGIGGGGTAQGALTGGTRTTPTSANTAGGTAPAENDQAETSEFMQIVGEMLLQQAVFVGGSIMSNMQPDDTGDE